LRSMELGPRDRLSQCFVKEQEKGRTLEGPYGHYVHLDIRHLGKKLIERKIPFVRELCLKYVGIDPVNEMIPVRPVVHYMMGGIHTDIHGATPVRGLYAAGEAACVSINGANRLGSNSLTEILVFGARAGKAAAAFAAEQAGTNSPLAAQARDEQRRLEEGFLRKNGGRERIAMLRAEMHQSMEESAGIYRTETALKEATGKVKRLQERFQDLSLDDHSYTFNTELTAALELSYMLDVAQTILQSALERRESRGSHQRTDYPQRDDERFLAHSLAYRTEDDSPRIEYRPVTITRWPPGKRVYGR
jgi:fumarate reductase flavoprotein subunit